MSDFNKFISDVGVKFVASAISMLLGFPITVFLGRFLGAGDLGLYRMLNAIYGTIMLFSTIGIPTAIIKFIIFRDVIWK